MKRALLLIAGLALSACAASSPRTGPLISKMMNIPSTCLNATGLATNAVCAGTDLASTAFAKPEPRRNFEYAETDAFDLQLSSSLGAGLNLVTATVAGDDMRLEAIASQTVAAADSERIVFWVSRIRDTGGESLACPVEATRSLDIAGWAVQLGAAYLEDWLIYKPAANYNVRVMYDKEAMGEPIRSFQFVPRSAGPLTCK